MNDSLRKNIAWIIDLVALIVGIAALVCGLGSTDERHCSILCIIAGFACLGYFLYALILWIIRPKFDWHLINGHFLRKVCRLVLLAPSFLTLIAVRDIDSPKQLAFEDNLYFSTECKQDTLIGTLLQVNDSLCTESSVKLYRSVEEKLPNDIARAQKDPSIYWSVYYHFIDPGNQHMTTTERGRFWAALIGILGVFLLNGLLVSSIIGYIDRRKEKWQKGEVRYKWFLKHYPHYVIIGGNDMVLGIVIQLLTKTYEDKHFLARFSRPYVLIQTARDVEEFRRELFATLSEEAQKRIIIYYGSRTSEKDVKELYIENAVEVYILGEETRTDDLESYHDTMNMECLNLLLENYKRTTKGQEISAMLSQVNAYRKQLEESVGNESQLNKLKSQNRKLDESWERRSRLKCRIMFEYQTTFSVFQFYDVNEEVEAYIDFLPFNYYEMWAQKVFINQELDKDKSSKADYLPLEGVEGIKYNDEKYVHLFIVGMSRMGIAMGVEAAHLAHYPNYVEKGIRTKITFIDKNAVEEKDFFMGRFKELFMLSHWRYGNMDGERMVWQEPHVPSDVDHLGGDFLDIEWEFINGGIEQTPIQDYILTSANSLAKVTIAICLPESNRSHAAALYLNKKIYDSDAVQQVLVYNRYGNSIVNAISSSGRISPYLGKLRSFGSASSCYMDNYLILSERIGKYIGQVYNAESNISNIVYRGKSKAACRWSNIYNGNMLWTKLRCVDFYSSNFVSTKKILELLADLEHNRWNMEQLLMNFRPLTNEEQKKVGSEKKHKNVLKSQMAHLDICSNQRLLEIDADVRKYDVHLTECLFAIYNGM